jgi:hypothetical protein
VRILASKSTSFYLLVNFCSSSDNSKIILEKLGDIGCSSFADINTLMVAKLTTCSLLKLRIPTAFMYLSKIPAATNKVSHLYSFF